MTAVIWVTGPAACGKSTLAAQVTKLLRSQQPHRPVELLTDEELLLAAVAADTSHQHHTHPYGDQRFIADGYLFDDGVRQISARVLRNIAAGTITVVELARGGHDPGSGVDVTYQRALELIDPSVWPHSTAIALAVPWQVRCSRNLGRARAHGRGTPPEVMTALYQRAQPAEWTAAGITVNILDGQADPSRNAAQVLTLAGLG